MADPFDITTPAQRRIVLVGLAAYVVLFALQLTTGNVLAEAGADLLLALLVIPMSVVAIRRATEQRTTDRLAVATAGAFLVAGLTIGYEGLAALELVPINAAISTLGTVALLAALVLYLYQRRSQSQ